jgi:hypothetical protein
LGMEKVAMAVVVGLGVVVGLVVGVHGAAAA